jgi:hypothetical protein
LPLESRLLKYYSLVIPELEAEEELRHRMLDSALTPDRYYNLLIQVGVKESEAESARANLLLQQTQKQSWHK